MTSHSLRIKSKPLTWWTRSRITWTKVRSPDQQHHHYLESPKECHFSDSTCSMGLETWGMYPRNWCFNKLFGRLWNTANLRVTDLGQTFFIPPAVHREVNTEVLWLMEYKVSTLLPNKSSTREKHVNISHLRGSYLNGFILNSQEFFVMTYCK